MKREDMNSIKCEILGLKGSETENFLRILDSLTNEDKRGMLSNSKSVKIFLEELMVCFEYETQAEIKEREEKYRLKYKACELNAVKYFENIQFFIEYNKWTVRHKDYFKKSLIDRCTAIDAGNVKSDRVVILKGIAEFVESEISFESDYKRNALVSFIEQQTEFSKRKTSNNKYLEGRCEDFVRCFNAKKYFSNKKFIKELSDDVKTQIADNKKMSDDEKFFKLVIENKISDDDLNYAQKEFDRLMK